MLSILGSALLVLLAAWWTTTSMMGAVQPASLSHGPAAYTYDATSYVYDAPALLSSQSTATSGVRGSLAGTVAASWGRSASDGFGVAADTGGSGLLRLTTEESWGNPATLDRHFLDHGADFGAATADEYAAQASEFFQEGLADGLPTKVDSSGVTRVYDPNTNSFGSFNADGTTKTFFKPDPALHGYPTNWDYWLAQPGVAP